MAKDILIIGGTRFFGKRLVRGLLAAGHRVTLATRGRAGDDFGDAVRRLVVDRRDDAALRRAAAVRDHDLVFDQMCYSPLDARRSVDAFAGRAGRYVMSSTIEVYRGLVGARSTPFTEEAAALPADEDTLDRDPRWDDPAWADPRYGDGKRRAEAWFARDGRLPVAAVRIAHVLGGPEDFTGRLAAHVRAAREGRPLALAGSSAGTSSFISPAGIAAFLRWVGDQQALGPINACDTGGMDAASLHRRVGQVLGRPVEIRADADAAHAAAAAAAADPTVADPDAASPVAASLFDYPARYEMDTARARALGYRFGAVDDWLDDTIRAHAAALESGRR